MKTNATLGWSQRTNSQLASNMRVLQNTDADKSKGKTFEMNVDLLRNVDTTEIEHLVVLDKGLLEGVSEGKAVFDSEMDLVGSFGFTSGSDQMNSFVPRNRSQSQQMLDSMFDVSWDNRFEQRAREGQSGSNSNRISSAYESYKNFTSFKDTVEETIERVQDTWETVERAWDGDTDAMVDLGVDIAQTFTPWYIDPIIEAIGGAIKGANNWLTYIVDWFGDTTGFYHENPDDITGGGGNNDLLLSGDHLLKEKILRGLNPRIDPCEDDHGNNYGIVFVEDPTSFLSGSNFGTSTGKFHEEGGAIIATGKHIDDIFTSHGGTSTGGADNI